MSTADDAVRQPLISGSLDPPHRPNKTSSIKKRRFRRCKSAPSVDAFLDPANPGGLFPGADVVFSKTRPSFRHITLLLIIYLALGAGCFYLIRDQIRGMAIVALFLSKAADYIVEKQEILLVKALHVRNKAGDARMLREIEANRVRYKFLTNAVFLVLLVAAGTIFLCKVEKLDLVDAFYCVCCTITTLGYGDKSFSSEGGRVFAVFWILTSCICLAQFFLYLAEVYTERRQHLLAKWVLTRRMTFVDLEAADLDEDGVVGAAEFIIYKLKEMGKISQEDIALVMEEFEDLDVDQSGAISASDLAQSNQ